MAPKVLLRCDTCQQFGASYLVEDPQLGRLRLCYACWRVWQRAHPLTKDEPDAEPKNDQPPSSPTIKPEAH